MPKTLLANYYDERIEALRGLLADAPDDVSRQVYADLLERYHQDRANLDRNEIAGVGGRWSRRPG